MTEFAARTMTAALMLLSWLLPLSSSQAACSHVLHVGFNDWPPYSWSEGTGPALGLDVELLKVFAERAGCEIVFDKMPPKRSHQLMRSGKIDIMMGASRTEDRVSYAFFSLPYRLEVVSLFSMESASVNDISSWAQVMTAKHKLLVPQAGWYGDDFEQNKDHMLRRDLLVESPDLLRSVQMLARGRGDLAIGDSLSLPYIASQSEQLHLYRHSVRLSESEIHLMFSRESMSKEEVDAFNHAIGLAGEEGEIARLQFKWEQISLSRIEGHSDNGAGRERAGPVMAE